MWSCCIHISFQLSESLTSNTWIVSDMTCIQRCCLPGPFCDRLGEQRHIITCFISWSRKFCRDFGLTLISVTVCILWSKFYREAMTAYTSRYKLIFISWSFSLQQIPFTTVDVGFLRNVLKNANVIVIRKCCYTIIAWFCAWRPSDIIVPHSCLQSGLDDTGFGFDLVGGKDDPQLPNDNSIFVSNVTKGSAADGKLK